MIRLIAFALILSVGLCLRTSAQESNGLIGETGLSGAYWKNSNSPRGVNSYQNVKYRSVHDNDFSEQIDDDGQQQEPIVRPVVLQNWPENSMATLKIDPRNDVQAEVPEDHSDQLIAQYERNWNAYESIEKCLVWESPNIRYQPLYFEDVDLERYGHVVRDDLFQSAISFAHFFTSAALLPLHMRHDPVYSCDYPLGYCRPGNCTNRIYQRSFWSRAR